MAIVFPNDTQDECARILQVVQHISDNEYSTNSTSFVNSGLITINFPNTLKSGSKVLATIELSQGESSSSSWAQPHYFTLFEGTSSTNGSNIAHSTRGMVGSCAISMSSSGHQIYDQERVSATNLSTPATTNPYYRLYVRTNDNTRYVTIGSAYNSNSFYNTGRTIVTLMEVCA